MPDSNDQLNNWLSDKVFSLSGLIKGKVDQLNIAHFDVGATGGFSLKSEGNVTFVTDMEKIAGKLDIAFVVIGESISHLCCQRMGRPDWLFRIICH